MEALPPKSITDLFTNLQEKESDELKDIFVFKRYKKGAFIFTENQIVKDVYFIHSGLVKLSRIDEDDQEFILSFAYENWWETDFSAFYNQGKSTYRLQCLEDTEVFALNFDDYSSLLDKYGLANYFLDKSIKGHIASQNRILSLLALKPKERYEQFVQLYPSLMQRIPKTVVAQYLGVSRETLSRLYQKGKR